MIAIGIDPSSTNIWLCVMEVWDKKPIMITSFKWKSTLDKNGRLIQMTSQLRTFLAELPSPESEEYVVFIEYPVVFKDPRSSLVVWESLWWIKSAVYASGFWSCQEVNVMEAKKLTGKKDKKDVFRFVLDIFSVNGRNPPKNDHEADSYLITVAWIAKFLPQNS